MLALCFFLVGTPLRALNPARGPASYSLQGWFTEQGLPSNRIRDIVQTRDGYLWLATGQGIARFDGARFTVFNTTTHPALQGTDCYAIVEAPDGALWIGGEDGLFRWRDGQFTRFTTADGLPHNYVRGLALRRDGTVVACTRRGYSFVRDGKVTTPPWPQPSGVGRAFLECSDGTLLLGTTTGLWRVTGNAAERAPALAALDGDRVYGLAADGQGALWIASESGLHRYAHGVLQHFFQSENEKPMRKLLAERPDALMPSLAHNWVAAVATDGAEEVWGASEAGLYQRVGEKFRVWTKADGLPGNNFEAVLCARNGDVWAVAPPFGAVRWHEGAGPPTGAAASSPPATRWRVRAERDETLREIDGLRKNIEHIKDIVAMQQSHAKGAGFSEKVGVAELIEDALRIAGGSLARHGVQLARDFRAAPEITVQRHKVVQILVNLLRNAKQACNESGRAEKRITVSIHEAAAGVQIAIADNGAGIAAENLTRIFAHGFTTRKNGHGFGLHSGALAASELGGSLAVRSDGPARGAMFLLTLPMQLDLTAA